MLVESRDLCGHDNGNVRSFPAALLRGPPMKRGVLEAVERPVVLDDLYYDQVLVPGKAGTDHKLSITSQYGVLRGVPILKHSCWICFMHLRDGMWVVREVM